MHLSRKKKTGTAVKVKGWWERGDIQTAASKTEMQCWIHKEESKKLRNESAQRGKGTRLDECVNHI
jgi:hypothetical protein